MEVLEKRSAAEIEPKTLKRVGLFSTAWVFSFLGRLAQQTCKALRLWILTPVSALATSARYRELLASLLNGVKERVCATDQRSAL